jgi:kanamycin kinase
VPDVVSGIADGRPVVAVWLNELGGVTFSVDDGAEFVKVYPDIHAAVLVAEAERMQWAARFVAVPKVLSSGPGVAAHGGPARPRTRTGCPPRHGDACAANTLIDDAGRSSGHVDLSDLGVADRWADRARTAHYRERWEE